MFMERNFHCKDENDTITVKTLETAIVLETYLLHHFCESVCVNGYQFPGSPPSTNSQIYTLLNIQMEYPGFSQ